MPSLNLIGGGQVGKALAYLLVHNAGFQLHGVLNRSLESAISTCRFIGGGEAVVDYAALPPGDMYFVTVPDQHIEECLKRLLATATLPPQTIIVHCSGFFSSALLAPAKNYGAEIVSVHPIKSFVDPARSVQTFAGTYCTLEGDANACAWLTPYLEKIGGIVLPIASTHKVLYHSALVIACNYLVALHEAALHSLEAAGITRETGNKLLAPLMRHTLEQSLTLGTQQALSGPIARGDTQVVREELAALQQWDRKLGDLYQVLGKNTLALSEKKAVASAENLQKIHHVLHQKTDS